jgi:light-regulated signal transduction histidine kinase (bacteriophytochrome)
MVRSYAGQFEIGGKNFDLHTSGTGRVGIIEIEPKQEEKGLDSDLLRELNALVQRSAVPETEQAFFNTTAQLLRGMTGYDRVMLYRFDEEFNGEVVAENRKPRMESFLGLRFPHWDIPAQARDIMREIPLRFIADATQEQIGLRAANEDTPPLDMTHAHLRGVSPIHIQYLQNMGTHSSMTLSIVLDGKLWGMIALHELRPKVPPMRIRQICDAFMPYFVAQLKLHHKVERLLLAKDLEDLQSKLNEKINRDDDFESIFDNLAPRLAVAFNAQGMAMVNEGGVRTFGETPKDTFFKPAAALISSSGEEIGTYDAIGEIFPELKETLGSIAGVLAVVLSADKAI